MLPASVQGPGMNMGFPDVCLTPAVPAPIPIPYPNMAMHAMAVPTCPTILNMMMPALNMATIIPMTMGDNAGVANPLFMQMGMFTMGSPKVLLQGMPAITMTSTTMGNAGNNPVGAVLVPGAPTILYGCAVPARELSTSVYGNGAIEASMVAPGVGRIAIRIFSRGMGAAVHRAIGELQRAGLARLIFDLRDNPGGEVLSAVELLRDLLPEGSVVVTVEDCDGDELTYHARGDAYPWPILVQVNGGTASAAELFAGCLQAHGRARVVGQRTYGKGVIRTVTAGAFTEAGRIRLPGHVEVDGVGVTPDEAEIPEEWTGAVDGELTAADRTSPANLAAGPCPSAA
jgi:carboxyl-terminal processing protease